MDFKHAVNRTERLLSVAKGAHLGMKAKSKVIEHFQFLSNNTAHI